MLRGAGAQGSPKGEGRRLVPLLWEEGAPCSRILPHARLLRVTVSMGWLVGDRFHGVAFSVRGSRS